MTGTEPELVRVSVDGGAVMVGRWGGGTTPVLSSHGITADHLGISEVVLVGIR